MEIHNLHVKMYNILANHSISHRNHQHHLIVATQILFGFQ